MKKLTNYTYYDTQKLKSVGFNDSTIKELIQEFKNYLLSMENEYNKLNNQNSDCSYIFEMLHKLEGSINYLALTGPIAYIKNIRSILRSNTSGDTEQMMQDLFLIIHRTIVKLESQYNIPR